MSTSLHEPIINLKVSEMADNLIGSEIIKLAGEVKAKMDQGEKIYNLTIGDFNPKIFPIPVELKNEIIKAYQNEETNYPPANGVQVLREAVSRFLHTREGLEYNANQILISGGARPLIYAVYQTLIDPQDKVLFPVPSWNNNHYTHLSRGQQIFVETTPENKFMPKAAELKPFISDATLLAVCSPLNPTGTTFTEEGLKEICEMVLEENKKRGMTRKPLYLLYDQIYWTLTSGETRHVDPVTLCPDIKNYTIYIDGISKAFAATGVRVGWAFGPQKIIDKMRSILSHVGAWAPKAEQIAVANFLVKDEAIDNYLFGFKSQINQRLTAIYNGIIDLKNQGYQVDAIAPEAAIYLTVNFNLVGKKTDKGQILTTTADVTKYLLEEAKIAIVPFNAFGSDSSSTWYRLSVGTAVMTEIDAMFVQLKDALSKLK